MIAFLSNLTAIAVLAMLIAVWVDPPRYHGSCALRDGGFWAPVFAAIVVLLILLLALTAAVSLQ
jgi:hypothetical protein